MNSRKNKYMYFVLFFSLFTSFTLSGCGLDKPQTNIDNNSSSIIEQTAPNESSKTENTDDSQIEEDDSTSDITDSNSSLLYLPQQQSKYSFESLPRIALPYDYDYSAETSAPLKMPEIYQPFVDNIFFEGEHLVFGWEPIENASGYDIIYTVGKATTKSYSLEGGGYKNYVDFDYTDENYVSGIMTVSECMCRVHLHPGEAAQISIRPRNANTPSITEESLETIGNWYNEDEWRTIDPIFYPTLNSKNYIYASTLSYNALLDWAESLGLGYETYVQEDTPNDGLYILMATPDNKNSLFEIICENILDSVPKGILDYLIGVDRESQSVGEAVENSSLNGIDEGIKDYFKNDYNIYLEYYYQGDKDTSATRCRVWLPYNNRKDFDKVLSQYGTDASYGTDSEYFSGNVAGENTLYWDYKENNVNRRIFLHYELFKNNSDDENDWRWVETIYSEPVFLYY